MPDGDMRMVWKEQLSEIQRDLKAATESMMTRAVAQHQVAQEGRCLALLSPGWGKAVGRGVWGHLNLCMLSLFLLLCALFKREDCIILAHTASSW